MDKQTLLKNLNEDLAGELSAIIQYLTYAAKTNREMVEAVLTAESRAIKDYTRRAKEAEAFGDKGLMVQLEDMVRDESNHAEETERLLRDWPL
jgi:bacterioferritin